MAFEPEWRDFELSLRVCGDDPLVCLSYTLIASSWCKVFPGSWNLWKPVDFLRLSSLLKRELRGLLPEPDSAPSRSP